MREALEAYPQARHFEGRIDDWIATTMRVEADGAMWMWRVLRVSGFVGVDIGTLVSAFQGQCDASGSACEIVAEKLLLSAPQATGSAIERGRDMEPLIRTKARALLQGKGDDAGMSVISRGRGPTPWMLYAPDDVLVVDGRRWLLNYNCSLDLESEVQARERHSARLHQGRMVAMHNGLAVDVMAVAQWDYQSWRPVVFEIAHDAHVDEIIVAAGDHYWNECVLTGDLPECPAIAADFALPRERSTAIAPVATKDLLERAAPSPTETDEAPKPDVASAMAA
jgi:hypothetical protein